MRTQLSFRMPAFGECWQHYKGGDYSIVGISFDHKGRSVVIYTDADWDTNQPPLLYSQPLSRFLQEVENGKPRFVYLHPRADDIDYAYLNPKLQKGK